MCGDSSVARQDSPVHVRLAGSSSCHHPPHLPLPPIHHPFRLDLDLFHLFLPDEFQLLLLSTTVVDSKQVYSDFDQRHALPTATWNMCSSHSALHNPILLQNYINKKNTAPTAAHTNKNHNKYIKETAISYYLPTMMHGTDCPHVTKRIHRHQARNSDEIHLQTVLGERKRKRSTQTSSYQQHHVL